MHLSNLPENLAFFNGTITVDGEKVPFQRAALMLGNEDDRIVISSTGVFSGAVKLNGSKGIDTQTKAPAAIFVAKTKSIEVEESTATADVLPDTAASNLSDEYVARGGEAADISCP